MTTTALPAPTLLRDGLGFPEGSRWRDGRFYFSDMGLHQVLTVDAGGALDVVAEVARPSGLGWTSDGHLLVVSMLDRRLIELDGTQEMRSVDLRPLAVSSPNDMVVSDTGFAYIGQVGVDVADPPPGPRPNSALLLATRDGQVEIAADDMACANGAVITPDGNTLVVAESDAHRLTAFDIAADGRLEGRRVFAELGDDLPDGICLDADGGVWAACVKTNRFIRVLEGGRVTHAVSVSGFALACALGGDDGRTLYLCTNDELNVAVAADRRTGRIETVRVDVPGQDWA